MRAALRGMGLRERQVEALVGMSTRLGERAEPGRSDAPPTVRGNQFRRQSIHRAWARVRAALAETLPTTHHLRLRLDENPKELDFYLHRDILQRFAAAAASWRQPRPQVQTSSAVSTIRASLASWSSRVSALPSEAAPD